MVEVSELKDKDVLASIVKSSSPAIVATDLEGRITFFSRGAEQLFGFKPEEVLGKPARFFYLRGESEAHSIMNQLKKEEKIQRYKTKILTKSQSVVPVIIDAVVIKNEQGESIGTIGVCTSILEEQKLEEQVKAQERFLGFILKNSADAIIVLDMQDRIMLWNKGAEMIFGYSEEEVKGKTYYFLISPEMIRKGEIEHMNKELWEKGHIRNYFTDRVCKDGEKITINLTRSLVRDEHGEPIGSSSIVRDITYQKQLEKQMVFTEKMATIGKLASSLAHEIGTPLNILSGRAEYIKKIARDNEEICKSLDIIIQQSEKITKKVANLLNVARQDHPEISRVSLKNIIFSVLDLLKTKLDKMNIEAQTVFNGEEIILNADADMLQQVFINLMVNSIDALKRKTKKKIEIIVKSDNEGGQKWAKIDVMDNGCGISPENVSRIFDPFFTTKDKAEGTGLGLSIVAQIVQDHHGMIEVQSVLNQGTKFMIKLPVNS